MKLRLCHLYPELLNLYGDRGNVLILRRRAEWRGIEVEVTRISLGDKLDPKDYDLFFLGGGPDQEQGVASADLVAKGPWLKEAVEAGAALMAICGGYQLLGEYYRTSTGETLPGVGLFAAYTEAGNKRLKGNIAIQVEELGTDRPVIGFENHGGRTFLKGARPLGRVIYGDGNNGTDQTEGARYRNAIGTYLHGPLLSKNPHLADYLLRLALQRRYGEVELPPLDDTLELAVNQSVYQRFLPKKGKW
ncbi:Cobyric acid synthase [Neomoorella glycerini]|uniref:Lipid II isoglutaminyl synthase (glutamine-hydrolyzing) subunit GatD n=1 Tax=Neomoorella glycerini TaxID=55779 RepID=A0A6I5ZT57_9FIRM|nr:glutamine amidotransferase [Moorella glycerini]QGP93090.1 Cobyric acid synthase [Moorella glycerini]